MSSDSPRRGSARRSTSTPAPRLRRDRLARLSEREKGSAAPARRRGARLPRDAHLGHPSDLGAPAHRHRPGRGDRDHRPRGARGARDRRRRPPLECRADAPGHRELEPAADAEPRSKRARRSSPSSPTAGGRSRSAGSRTRASAGRTSAIPRAAAPPRFGRGWLQRSDRVGCVDGFPIRRNTVLLAATLTCLSGMVQLAVAVATVTLVLVTGIEGILGLGPAIFLTAGALAALPAGRLDGPSRPDPRSRGWLCRRHRRLSRRPRSARVSSPRRSSSSGSRSSASPRGRSCWRGPRPPTCTRPRDAPAESPTSSSARSSVPRSARSSSGRSSPARSSTPTP